MTAMAQPGRISGSKFTFIERKSVGLDFLRFLKSEEVSFDDLQKSTVGKLYKEQYKSYRSQITPNEKIPHYFSVFLALKKSDCVHLSGKVLRLGPSPRYASRQKNGGVHGGNRASQSPESSTGENAASRGPSVIYQRNGSATPDKDGEETHQNKSRRRQKRRVKTRVAVDQHIPFNKETAVQRSSSTASQTADEGPPETLKYITQNVCTVCQCRCSSQADIEAHVRGRKHRVAVLMAGLRDRKKELIQDKFGLEVRMEVRMEEGTYYFDLKEKETLRKDLIIENKGEHSVELLHCEMMKKNRVFQLTDVKKVTDSMNTVSMPPGSKYVIKVEIQAKHVGNYHVPVTLQFNTTDSDTEFHIVRFLHARCFDKTVEDLKKNSTPFKRPPRVVHGHEVVELVPGTKLPKIQEDKMERMIKLGFYNIPSRKRLMINRGLTDNKDRLTPDEKEELRKLRETMESPLNMESYVYRFETLLHFEEVQMEVDIRKYDMTDVTMALSTTDRHLLILEVPGLAENRPSVLRGDCLYVRILANGVPIKKEYEGYVHQIRQNEVALGFSSSLRSQFIPNMKFKVRFEFSRLPIRLQHRACHLAKENSLDDILFPKAANIPENISLPNLILCNTELERNTEQKCAVQHIVAGTSGSAPYIVFGPPGTGKTVTIVEAMNQIIKLREDCHILACTPSNSACDLITSRLLKQNMVSKTQIIRLNAMSRSWNAVPEDIKMCCNYSKMTGDYFYPKKEELSQYKVVVATLVTAGRIASANFPPGHFTHVFIDEAGHAVEPEALIALAGIVEPNKFIKDSGHVVIAGDPKQLGPVLRSPFAIKYGFEMSLLERYMETCDIYKPRTHGGHAVYNVKVITKLLRNYRSHPAILDTPNKMFYQSELLPCAGPEREKLCHWDGLPKKGFPVIFHSIIGEDLREEKSPSFFNPQEASCVLKYVEALMEARQGGIKLKQGDIGVISPYRKQVQKLQQLIRKKKYDKISVGSVEEFQGQERTVIIVSTVRSNPEYMSMDTKFKLGFLKNPKRFNVTMTRAKALLIVVGNPQTLCKDEHWKRFIQYCRKNGGYMGTDTLDEEDEVEDLLQRLQAVHLTTEQEVELPLPAEASKFNEQPWRQDM